MLKDIVRENKFDRLTPDSSQQYRDKFFTPIAKAAIRAKWEKMTGQKWPTYKEDIRYPNGKIARYKGNPYDIHHIIFNSHEGPHAWYNSYPMHMDNHNKLHFDSKSAGNKLFNLKESQK